MKKIQTTVLTKRELIAAMAMQAYISNYDLLIGAQDAASNANIDLSERVAISSTVYADALILELEKGE